MSNSPITKGLTEVPYTIGKELNGILSDIPHDVVMNYDSIKNTFQLKEGCSGKVFLENDCVDVYETSLWFIDKLKENPKQYYEPFKKFMHWFMKAAPYLV